MKRKRKRWGVKQGGSPVREFPDRWTAVLWIERNAHRADPRFGETPYELVWRWNNSMSPWQIEVKKVNLI